MRVFLASAGGIDAEIDALFRAAISTAKQQKSLSFEKRAEATYAEYCSPKSNRLNGGQGWLLLIGSLS